MEKAKRVKFGDDDAQHYQHRESKGWWVEVGGVRIGHIEKLVAFYHNGIRPAKETRWYAYDMSNTNVVTRRYSTRYFTQMKRAIEFMIEYVSSHVDEIAERIEEERDREERERSNREDGAFIREYFPDAEIKHIVSQDATVTINLIDMAKALRKILGGE